MSKRIVIIGAGPAGLTAALELLRQGNDNEVIVLETERTVGGLAKTITWGNNKYDIGGHRFFSADDQIIKWWNDILPMSVVNRHSSIFFRNQYIDYPIKLSVSMLKKLGRPLVLRIIWSYLEMRVRQPKVESLEDFFISRFGGELYRLFFHDYTKKVWGREPSEISQDWGPERIKGISLTEIIRNVIKGHSQEPSLTEYFLYPPNGCGDFWETVANMVIELGGTILMEHKVTQLKRDRERIIGVHCTTPTGSINIAGDSVISTMPLQDLIGCIPDVPGEVSSVASRLRYRDMIVVGVTLDKRVLAVEGSPLLQTNDQWIYVQDKDIEFGRIQIMNNWSITMVDEPESHILLALEYFCQSSDALWRRSDKDWQDRVASDLFRIGLIHEENAVIGCSVNTIAKAYPCYWDGYQDIREIEKFVDAIQNLVCIGRNGGHKYLNMDSVMINAIELVRGRNKW